MGGMAGSLLAILACLLALQVSTALELVDVFNRGEAGYFCIKIPYLLATSQTGTLLAFAEARWGSCSDYAPTDLVTKRSVDGGKTWSDLKVVFGNATRDRAPEVVGNANPVQLAASPRILLPFCVNNSKVMLTYSDDYGKTWAMPPRDLSSELVRPEWGWVGLGPPAGLELSSGRVLLPGYHGPSHGTDGTVTHPHISISDDFGKTWRLGFEWDSSTDAALSSECQLAELGNGSLLLSARTGATHRSQSISMDAMGDEWGPLQLQADLPQPFDGVEGSVVAVAGLEGQPLYLTSLHEHSPVGLRFNMTLSKSLDGGQSWQAVQVIDTGSSAYSALQVVRDAAGSPKQLGLLFERSNKTRPIFLPDHISYTVLESWQ